MSPSDRSNTAVRSREPAARFKGRRKPFRCPCDCGHFGLDFCPDHKARLAAIRVEYEQGWVRKLSSVGNGVNKQAGSPQCCLPTCWEPREAGHAYCWEHEQEDEE